MLDEFGNFMYSQAIPVQFSDELTWTIRPNPTKGKVVLNLQAAEGEWVQIKIYNELGALLQQQNHIATGFIEQAEVNIGSYSSGLYMVQVIRPKDRLFFKVIKQ
jgi:hypothetical protein